MERKKHAVIVAPPEHAKTGQIIGRLVHEVGRDPSKHVGLVAKDGDLVKKNMIRIRKALCDKVTQTVFPMMRPDTRRSKNAGEWSTNRLYLQGQSLPAFEGFTRDGQAEGSRLDIIWMDDCVTRECHRSQAERDAARSAIYNTWLNRITNNGICVISNNVWHREDPIHLMCESSSFSVLWVGYETDPYRLYWRTHHPTDVWKHGKRGEFKTLWDQWPASRLASKEAEDRLTWKRLYEGKAVLAEESRFPPMGAWKRYDCLPKPGSGERIYAHLDPSGGRSAHKGDFAALTLVMTTPDKRFFVLDPWVTRALPTEQRKACFESHRYWKSLGYQGIYRLNVEVLRKDQGWVTEPFRREIADMRARGDAAFDLPIRFTSPHENKGSRIERMSPYFENGWLEFPKDLERRMRLDAVTGRSWKQLVNQIEDWGLGRTHDDAPDSLAGALFIAAKRGAPAAREAEPEGGMSEELQKALNDYRNSPKIEKPLDAVRRPKSRQRVIRV